MEKIKFLMTDTGRSVTELCRETLEKRGVDVAVCPKDGAQALQCLLENRPQVALLDAFMPGLDALAVKQRYQENGGRGTVFFVTGTFQNDGVEEELLDNGFAFYFVKPFEETVLADRVLRAAGAAELAENEADAADALGTALRRVRTKDTAPTVTQTTRTAPAMRRRARFRRRRRTSARVNRRWLGVGE